jgi:hypothetical protein
MSKDYAVWISPTSYSRLCEPCLQLVRGSGASLADAVRGANSRGRLPTETDVGFIDCSDGHELVVRLVDRGALFGQPPSRHS